MSHKNNSGSNESLGPRGTSRGAEQNGDFRRPRASTLPSDIALKLKEGRRKCKEERISLRKQAWAMERSGSRDGNGENNHHHNHMDSHALGDYRARSNTMPSPESMRRTRGPASPRDAPTNLRVAALTKGSRDRSGSLDALTKKSTKNNHHIKGDYSPSAQSSGSSSEEHLESTEDFINYCIKISDEAMAVQREPLPKGSRLFEEVRDQIEHEKLDSDSVNNVNNAPKAGKSQTKRVRRKSHPAKLCHNPHSPKVDRHVHWQGYSSRK